MGMKSVPDNNTPPMAVRNASNNPSKRDAHAHVTNASSAPPATSSEKPVGNASTPKQFGK